MSSEFNINKFVIPEVVWPRPNPGRTWNPIRLQETDSEPPFDWTKLNLDLLPRYDRMNNDWPGIRIIRERKVIITPPPTAANYERHYTGVRPEPRMTILAHRPLARQSRTSCYWEDAGWERRDDSLIGHYKARGKRFRGSILLADSDYAPRMFFIYDPPERLLHGPHGGCYRLQSDSNLRKYHVHFAHPEHPRIDVGILQIERNLREALR